MIKASTSRSIILSICGLLVVVFFVAKNDAIVELFLTHEEETKGAIRSLSMVLDVFYKGIGYYPPTDQGLIALFKSSEVNDWNPPYLTDKSGLLDAWGNPFVYFSPPECNLNVSAHYEFYSTGENGIDNCGREDDIYYFKIIE